MAEITPIHIVGGGMAGSEAAWAGARTGVPIVLHEMRPERGTDAHQTDGLAELVCSNSFRSDDDETNAVGLLHWEMRALGSIMMEAAVGASVPSLRRTPHRAQNVASSGTGARHVGQSFMAFDPGWRNSPRSQLRAAFG